MTSNPIPLHLAETPNNVEDIERKIDFGHHENPAEKELTIDIPVSAYHQLGVRETLRTFRKTVLLCMLALFAVCSEGYQLSLPGNIIAQTSFIQQFGRSKTAAGAVALNAKDVAAWGGMYQGGYIAILLTGSYIPELLGRKASMYVFTLFIMIACILEMVAKDWIVWGISKMFVGFSVGLTQLTLSTYVSEVAPIKIRGLLLVGYAVWWSFGQLMASIALFALQSMKTRPRLYLRVVYSEWIFSGLAIIFITLIPESPRWHLRRGNREKAMKALERFNGGIPGYNVEHELSVLEYELNGQRALELEAAKTSYFDIFKGTNLRRTLVSFSILGWQQCVGIPIVFGYNSVFFKAAGLKNPFLGTLCISLIGLFTTFISGFMVDRFGRRPLLLIGGVFLTILLAIIGSLSFLKVTPAVGGATVAVMCLWVLAYSSSAGPCGYLLLGESSNLALRAKTTGFAAACSGMFGLIFSYCTPLMILPTGGGVGWGLKTAYVYSGLGFIGLVLIYFFVPEHKGRSYAELNELYENKVPARKFRQTQTSAQLAAGIEAEA